jgi:uncharacterized coiled-coil DUF342 family protein
VQQAVIQKRRAVIEEIDSLKAKEKCLHSDIDALTQSADKLAEQMHAVTLIT